MVSNAGPSRTSIRSAWGLAAMLARASAACSGLSSQVVIDPPGASPAAMAIDEYPVKVPISRTRRAAMANTSISRNRPSRSPTSIRASGPSCSWPWVRAATSARYGGGGVVWAAA
jgi:hypothetical protein